MGWDYCGIDVGEEGREREEGREGKGREGRGEIGRGGTVQYGVLYCTLYCTLLYSTPRYFQRWAGKKNTDVCMHT